MQYRKKFPSQQGGSQRENQTSVQGDSLFKDMQSFKEAQKVLFETKSSFHAPDESERAMTERITNRDYIVTSNKEKELKMLRFLYTNKVPTYRTRVHSFL